MKPNASTVSAGDFKARCLKLMDEVAPTLADYQARQAGGSCCAG